MFEKALYLPPTPSFAVNLKLLQKLVYLSEEKENTNYRREVCASLCSRYLQEPRHGNSVSLLKEKWVKM